MYSAYNTQVEEYILRVATEVKVSTEIVDIAKKIAKKMPEKGNRPKPSHMAAGAVWMAYILTTDREVFLANKWPLSSRDIEGATESGSAFMGRLLPELAMPLLGVDLRSIPPGKKTARIYAVKDALECAGGLDALFANPVPETSPA